MSEIATSVLGDDGYPLDRIALHRITAEANHGVLASEKGGSQPFSADVVIYLDTRAAAASDDLAKTVDYAEVANAVHHILTGPHVDLIETLAEQIAAAVLTFPQVVATDVVVHKPEAPLSVPFADVEVAIRRDHVHRKPATTADIGHMSDNISDTDSGFDGYDDATPIFAPPPSLLSAETVTSAPPISPAVPLSASAPTPQATPAPPTPTANPLDTAPFSAVKAIIALGSNLGDSKSTLRKAIAALRHEPGIDFTDSDIGPLARTSPVGGPPDQDDYHNSVLRVRTTLSPRKLMETLHRVEADFGRVRRSGEVWGPRTLDLDIITYGDLVAEAPDLAIPHKSADQRAFVLLPWAQLEPDAVLPGPNGGLVAALAETAPDRTGIRNMMLDWATNSSSAPHKSEGQAEHHHFGVDPDPLAQGQLGAHAAGASAALGVPQSAADHFTAAPLSAAATPDSASGSGTMNFKEAAPLTTAVATPDGVGPAWTPPAPNPEAPLPTFTGIITGIPGMRRSGGESAHPEPAPTSGTSAPGPKSAPTFTGNLRAESPLAARLARFTGGHGPHSGSGEPSRPGSPTPPRPNQPANVQVVGQHEVVATPSGVYGPGDNNYGFGEIPQPQIPVAPPKPEPVSEPKKPGFQSVPSWDDIVHG